MLSGDSGDHFLQEALDCLPYAVYVIPVDADCKVRYALVATKICCPLPPALLGTDRIPYKKPPAQ